MALSSSNIYILSVALSSSNIYLLSVALSSSKHLSLLSAQLPLQTRALNSLYGGDHSGGGTFFIQLTTKSRWTTWFKYVLNWPKSSETHPTIMTKMKRTEAREDDSHWHQSGLCPREKYLALSLTEGPSQPPLPMPILTLAQRWPSWWWWYWFKEIEADDDETVDDSVFPQKVNFPLVSTLDVGLPCNDMSYLFLFFCIAQVISLFGHPKIVFHISFCVYVCFCIGRVYLCIWSPLQ